MLNAELKTRQAILSEELQAKHSLSPHYTFDCCLLDIPIGMHNSAVQLTGRANATNNPESPIWGTEGLK